ncbi:MAG: carboxypeptidase regulatory-like domain-containing protein [Myxococcales bacterium]|nr:carboxypeptidase regulatory-like domain-containing protein [Myxococcales bacterium]MCB9715327.1 carboxypeptidase regulatory-like domain-containing protein [Myxococcales bacterium]
MRIVSCALLTAALLLGPGCRAPAPTNPPVSGALRGGATIVPARCVSTQSCLLGQVVSAESATPLARATVFLEREDTLETGADEEAEGGGPVTITTLTDDQGVFAVEEPPAGRYRLRVFKRERELEIRGLPLGEPGTTMVPVRLPQG